MKKEFKIDQNVIAELAKSNKLSDEEKLNFLAVIHYLTRSEQKELLSIV